MAEQPDYILSGIIIDEQVELSLDEVSTFCAVRREEIVILVEEGVLEPVGTQADEWRFGGDSLRRAAKALRLQRDLEISPGAVAVILDLMDENDRLRTQLALLRHR
jgi:chaperone modulatory protein CbpM